MACWDSDVDIASMPNSWRESMLESMANAAAPMIVTESCAPGRIVACNNRWNTLCGYAPEEALGKPPSILQGPRTSRTKAREFSQRVHEEKSYYFDHGFASRQAATSVKLVNYTKSGRPFVHCLRARRVMDEDTGVDYFVTTSYEETDEAITHAMLKADVYAASSTPTPTTATAATDHELRDALIFLGGLLVLFIPALYPIWSPRLLTTISMGAEAFPVY